MTNIDIKTYKKRVLPTNPKPNSVYYILPTPSSKVIVYITDQNGVPKIIESEGTIDLSYIASPTNGIVTSDTGTDATIPLANNTNAGLLTPAEKTKISTSLQSSDLSNLVPYTGATTNVDLGEFQLKAGQIELDQTPTGTAGVGIIRWNDEDGTIDVGLKGGNVTLQVGQEQVLRVVNKTGVNLLESEYKCVYISGAQGNRLKVDLALSNNTLNSNKTIGLVTENINNNLEGFVTTVGLVRGINTTGSLQGETWEDGDVLYLSAVSEGSLTNVAPTTPNHKVVVGYIVRAHITQGSIFVKVDTGLAITELHDVNITATTANKVIGSTTEGLWENKTIAQVLGYTPANIASPTFTGIPSAPTATVGTNTTQLATTAFVLANSPPLFIPNLSDKKDIIDITKLSITPNDLMWFKPYLASDYPEITCDKTYFFIYSTDHSEGIGEIWWGKGNNLDCSDFEEAGRILTNAYAPESPFLIRIPSAECGDSEVIHLYYHTASDDPTNASKQQTHLITTTGGLLHSATWTQRGTILGIVGSEDHTGYLKLYKLGISNYKGIHLNISGIPQNYSFSTSTNGRTFTRAEAFNKTIFAPNGFQYKAVSGGILINLYSFNWYIGSLMPLNNIGYKLFSLVKLDSNLQPIRYCQTLNDNIPIPIDGYKMDGDLEIYVESNIAYLYWKEGSIVKKGNYDLQNLTAFTGTVPPSYDTADLLVYYKFQNNVLDATGNHNGTAYNVTYQTGIIGNAYKGNGSDSYVDLNTHVVAGKSAITICAFVKQTSLDDARAIYSDWDAPYGVLLRFGTGGILQWYLSINGANIGGTFTTITDLNSFHSIVCVYDGVKMKMYVDNVDTGVKFIVYGAIESGGGFDRIGRYSTYSTADTIDNFMIWDKALSESERNDVYFKQMIGQDLI